jgi:hypothetical protein
VLRFDWLVYWPLKSRAARLYAQHPLPISRSSFIQSALGSASCDLHYCRSFSLLSVPCKMTFLRLKSSVASSILFSILLALNAQIVASAATCYNPDGTARSNPQGGYQPCQTGSGHSMCCNLQTDQCLPSGLCVTTGFAPLWRESCTDPTWKDPACLNLCTSGIGKMAILVEYVEDMD